MHQSLRLRPSQNPSPRKAGAVNHIRRGLIGFERHLDKARTIGTSAASPQTRLPPTDPRSASPPDRRGSRGELSSPALPARVVADSATAALGLSRIPRQSRLGCRGFRDIWRPDVAYSATGIPGCRGICDISGRTNPPKKCRGICDISGRTNPPNRRMNPRNRRANPAIRRANPGFRRTNPSARASDSGPPAVCPAAKEPEKRDLPSEPAPLDRTGEIG